MTVYVDTGADFSPCRTYRYRLWRVWDWDADILPWVCCNPSDADERRLDPSARKVEGFTCRLGYGGWVIVNAFALVSTDPAGLVGHPDPVGPMNDLTLRMLGWGPVVVAWGAVGGKYAERIARVRTLLADHGLLCLGTTKDGHPRHPVRLGYDTPLVPWSAQG